MLEHGGNLIAAAKKYNIPLENWLDLSTGINPNHYPIPTIPARAWQCLPEEDDGLIEVACGYYGCKSLLATAGSQAALQLLPTLRPPCNIAMPRNMYQEHAHAWQQHGHRLFYFDDAPDDVVLNQTDVLLLCNPNNPSGERYAKNQLCTWHQRLASRGAWLIVDEAFMDVTPDESIADVTHLEGLIVLKSLGKFFGLAGARVGFVLAHPRYLSLIQERMGPWTLTGASRYLAKKALLDIRWQVNTRVQLQADSEKLIILLKQFNISPTGGTALFQFIQTSHAKHIHHALATQGVWLRLFENNFVKNALLNNTLVETTSAIRVGLPPEKGWGRLETALSNID